MKAPSKRIEPTRERPKDLPTRRWRRIRRLLVILATIIVLGIGIRKAAKPAHHRIRLHLAERAIGLNRLVEARARLDLLIAENPSETWPRFLRAQVSRKQGLLTEADEQLQRALELGLPVDQARREHTLLRSASDFPRVELALRQLLEANPRDDEVRQALVEGREGGLLR